MKVQCPRCKEIFEIKSNVVKPKPKKKEPPKKKGFNWDKAYDNLFGT